MIPTIKNMLRPFTKEHGVNAAQSRVDAAIQDLERTVHMTREELFAEARIEVANDVQHTVVFSTFMEICRYRKKQVANDLCQNGAHDDSGTGVAQCAEELCPLMRKRAMTK